MAPPPKYILAESSEALARIDPAAPCHYYEVRYRAGPEWWQEWWDVTYQHRWQTSLDDIPSRD